MSAQTLALQAPTEASYRCTPVPYAVLASIHPRMNPILARIAMLATIAWRAAAIPQNTHVQRGIMVLLQGLLPCAVVLARVATSVL